MWFNVTLYTYYVLSFKHVLCINSFDPYNNPEAGTNISPILQ